MLRWQTANQKVNQVLAALLSVLVPVAGFLRQQEPGLATELDPRLVSVGLFLALIVVVVAGRRMVRSDSPRSRLMAHLMAAALGTAALLCGWLGLVSGRATDALQRTNLGILMLWGIAVGTISSAQFWLTPTPPHSETKEASPEDDR